jgi:hypothetical protein
MPRQTQREGPRGFLKVQDYLAWPGRKNCGDISTSEGVVLSSLLQWVRREHECPHDLSRSGATAAARQTENSAGEHGGNDSSYRQATPVAEELFDFAYPNLAAQASGWFRELAAIKTAAEELKQRYARDRTKVEPAPMPALSEKLHRLITLAEVLSTFSLTTCQLALLPRCWSEGAKSRGPENGRRQKASPKVDPPFQSQTVSPVIFMPEDGEFGSMLLLAISQTTLGKWSGYLLPLIQASAEAVSQELSRRNPNMSRNLYWPSIASTFDELVRVLRRQLGCPGDWKELDRQMRIVERVSKIISRERMLRDRMLRDRMLRVRKRKRRGRRRA